MQENFTYHFINLLIFRLTYYSIFKDKKISGEKGQLKYLKGHKNIHYLSSLLGAILIRINNTDQSQFTVTDVPYDLQAAAEGCYSYCQICFGLDRKNF